MVWAVCYKTRVPRVRQLAVKTVQLVFQSVRRNRRDFIFSSIGIVIGIGTLFFFTALGAGIQEGVLERVFSIRNLEVVKPSYDVGAFQTDGIFGGGAKLDDAMVERLALIPGVDGVFPKMKLTFPSSVRGGKEFIGKDMMGELIADGIPEELVGEVDGPVAFRDFEAITCTADDACPTGYGCIDGMCAGSSCDPAESGSEFGGSCGGKSYCDATTSTCRMPIPVIANPKMLELFNGSVHTALGGASGGLSKIPKLNEKALVGFEFEGVFGRSYLGRASTGDAFARRMILVGFSDKAIDIGATVPIGYVQRLNAKFPNARFDGTYHSIVLQAASNDVVAEIARQVTEDVGLALSDKYETAQRAGLMILLITLVFNLISLIILAIAAVNIMHTFLMIILERRRELALMRALGATKGRIRLLVLGEATLLGVFGGIAGVLLGFAGTRVIDFVFQTQVAEFPFKPESLFATEPWMALGAIAVALLFCWIGALLPAFRASAIDPAAALAGR